MKRILVIDPIKQKATFKDEEKEMTVRYNNINIRQDNLSRLFEVDMEFNADVIETK